jgi:hypothetical protein
MLLPQVSVTCEKSRCLTPLSMVLKELAMNHIASNLILSLMQVAGLTRDVDLSASPLKALWSLTISPVPSTPLTTSLVNGPSTWLRL